MTTVPRKEVVFRLKLTAWFLSACASAALLVAFVPAVSAQEAAAPDAAQLLADISFLENIARLGLTADQVKALAPQATAVQEAFARDSTRRKTAMDAMAPALEKRRSLLLKGMDTPPEVQTELDKGFAALSDSGELLSKDMTDIGRQIQGVLNDEQTVLALGDGTWRLETVRGWSGDDFSELGEAYAGELAARDESGKLTTAKVLDVLKTARNMSDDEFSDSADELTRTLVPALISDCRDHPDRLADAFSYIRAPDLLQEMAAQGGK